MVRKVLLVAAWVAVVLLLIGCRTVEGLGEDITWITEKSEEALLY